MAKSEEKIKARKLRRLGKSIKSIAKQLGVSSSSVSIWCSDIALTKEQIEKLQEHLKDPHYGRRGEYLKKIKEKKLEKIRKFKIEGIEEVGKLTKREIFIAGIALYWGEGFKKDHQVGLATSDVGIGKFFIYWLSECFKVEDKDLILRVTTNISYKNRVREIEKFWATKLKININQFSKPFFQNTKWKKVYENKDEYHGVLRIKVRRSVDFLRKIYGFIEGLNINS
jgi:transcriptional regulator with XRE-family HTH domain